MPLDDCAGRAGLPAQQRPHAGQQLAQRERLHEVVVGAVVEPGDAVLDTAPRREHQHPGQPTGIGGALLG